MRADRRGPSAWLSVLGKPLIKHFCLEVDNMDQPDIESIYNFLRLDERLITSGQPSEEELAAVARAGFEVVINLALQF